MSRMAQIKAAFERLVTRANRNGIQVVADADAISIRLIATNDCTALPDLHVVGELVRVNGACGGAAYSVSGDTCNYTIR